MTSPPATAYGTLCRRGVSVLFGFRLKDCLHQPLQYLVNAGLIADVQVLYLADCLIPGPSIYRPSIQEVIAAARQDPTYCHQGIQAERGIAQLNIGEKAGTEGA